MNKYKLSAFTAVVAGAMTLAACGGGEEGGSGDEGGGEGLETNIVTIATGGASGPYNIIGSTLADVYSNEYGVNSRTQTTGASVENVNLMKEDKIEMAFTMSDVVSQAVEGTESFSEPTDKISQIAALYPNYVQIVTTADSGIETFDDLAGKRIAVGDQNSGVEVNARTLLEGHGITYDDIQVDYLGYAEAADGLRAGQLDAAFLTSGLPNASLLELSETLDIRMVSVDPEDVANIAQDESYFVALDIPADTYGNEEAVPTAAIMNALIVHSDMSEDDVYKMTQTFFDSLETLGNSHQAATDITLEEAQEGLVAPLHPGAERYYSEQ